MKKNTKLWNIVFCAAFVLLCVVSMISVMTIYTGSAEKDIAYADLKEALVIDDFEEDEIINALGNKSNVYVKAPSKIMISRRQDSRGGTATYALVLKYDKENEGGPYGMGGWCGYYTLLKNDREGTYFDGSNYKYISMWVKGEKGDENFTLGLSDRHWDKVGDSLKSEEIITYIPEGRIGTEWIYVRVPIDEFFLDYSQLAAVTINFEGDCFPEGKSLGMIYVDDIMLEK